MLIISATTVSCSVVDSAISDVPTCDDGIMNNDETGVDCGGSLCPNACPSRMSAFVNGSYWNLYGNTISTQVNPSGSSLYISGTDSIFRTLSLIHTGPFIPGAYALSGGLYSTITPSDTYTGNTGSIIFTEFDTISKRVSGTFNFKAFSSSGDSVVVNNGSFYNIPF